MKSRIEKEKILSDIKSIIAYHQSNDTKNCLKQISTFVRTHPYLERLVFSFLKEQNSTCQQICSIAIALEILYNYSADIQASRALSNLISSCYARAYILSSISNKHRIAYQFGKFVEKTYFKFYNPQQKLTYYCSHVGDSLSELYCLGASDDLYDKELKKIYKLYHYNTPNGDVSYYQQRMGKLIQWYIFSHVLCLCEINPNIINLDIEELRGCVEECYRHLCNIESAKLKFFANQILSFFLDDHSDKEIIKINLEDSYYDDFQFIFNDNTCKIEYYDIDEIISREINEYERNASIEENNYDDYGNDDNHYAGTYAQDEMGYSDDDIDTIFDGDPSAYWNID